MCELTGADQRRPLGIFTNIRLLKARKDPGKHRAQLQRPLATLLPMSSCSSYPPIRGLIEREEFRSSSSLAFGKQFRWFSVASLLQFAGRSVLGCG